MDWVTASPILKSKSKNKDDERRRLLLATRIYINDNLKERFSYYIKDIDKPIYISASQLKNSMVVNHDKAIRYNSLISFAITAFKEIVTNELKTKTTLNIGLVKDLVSTSIKANFEIDFADNLNKQMVTLDGSGFNEGIDEITVDKRAIDAVASQEITDEPSVDPAGNVDLGDIDAGDIEIMIINEDNKLREEQEKIRISKIDTKTRYEKGLYNKNNIFELFASIYYDKGFADTYNKIVIRLFEYRQYVKPKEEIHYLNSDWIQEFFKYLWDEGYTVLSTRFFDPLKFDPSIFEKKRREKYSVDHFFKLFDIIKTVSNKFIDDGLIPKVNFSKVNLKKICNESKSKKGKRITHNLSNSEFNKLFFYKFDPNLLDKYQIIFNKKYDKKTIQITIDHLEIARDMFCLQVMSGGRRGYQELQTIKFNQNDRQLSFYMKKVDDWMINPLNVYTKQLAKDYNYNIPNLDFKNSENTKEHIYRSLLKTIAEIIPFHREILVKKELKKIKEVFNPYFARKTFSQIMFDRYNFTLENIAMFTGHEFESRNKSVLLQNYIDDKSPMKKKKLFKKIKVPKRYTKDIRRKLTKGTLTLRMVKRN
ncbi:hypothetical protein ACFLU5_11900 [Bacteroidota bacterium]